MSSKMVLARKLPTTFSMIVLSPQGRRSLGWPMRQDSPAPRRIPEIFGRDGNGLDVLRLELCKDSLAVRDSYGHPRCWAPPIPRLNVIMTLGVGIKLVMN